MTTIRIGQETLVLAGSSQVALTRNSPLLAEEGQRGNTSLPINAPRAPNHDRILGYPARFDHEAGRPPSRFEAELLDNDGQPITTGTLVLRTIEERDYVLNLEFGASDVMSKLKARPLRSFRFGGGITMKPTTYVPGDPFNHFAKSAVSYMKECCKAPFDHRAVFAPVSNDLASGQWPGMVEFFKKFNSNPNKEEPDHTITFNTWGTIYTSPDADGMGFGYSVPFVVIGPQPPTTVSILPLPRLEYVIRQIFQELRIPLIEDVFDEPELRQIVCIPTNSVLGKSSEAPGDDYFLTFNIGDHLPDISAHELIRRYMDSLGLHFDVTPTGEARLLRSGRIIRHREPVDLTQRVSPAFSREPQAGVNMVVAEQLADQDEYTQALATQPDPAAILVTVAATAADLSTATQENVYQLVSSENRYYKTVSKRDDTVTPPVYSYLWKPGPYRFTPVVVKATESTEESEDYTVGHQLVLEQKMTAVSGGGITEFPVSIFMEEGNNTSGSTSTKALRLSFFRGLRPVPGTVSATGQPFLWPHLTQTNLDVDGVSVIGQYALRVAGPAGLVAKHLQQLLVLRGFRDIVKFPSYLSAVEFRNLDFGRPVEIRGDLFILRTAKIALPLRKPGSLELVPALQIGQLERDVDAPTGPTCDVAFLGIQVQNRAAGHVTVLHSGNVVGPLLYRLVDVAGGYDSGFTIDPEFLGLQPDHQYQLQIQDSGISGCEVQHLFTL
jgi:hypothetical protein